MKETGEIEIKSLLLTSEVVPIIYLKAGELAMPIVSYPDLRRAESEVLKDRV